MCDLKSGSTLSALDKTFEFWLFSVFMAVFGIIEKFKDQVFI